MKTKIPKNKQFAFWTYDLFPYCLGGTVTEITKDGSVETKEFGPGYYFEPFLFTTLERGEQIKNQLKELRENREIAIQAVKTGFILALEKIIKLPK